MVKKFYSEDQQNCFNCPFQCNGSKWRINFSTSLCNIFRYSQTENIVSIDFPLTPSLFSKF
ncbi:hypothetical protein [Leptospira kirschneri]|uniref:hypothetical protein n=1 Tax=Leptospira kirschneri TaxID=29507 RepID=UPI000A2F6F2D|nr:hypothetical protein [Leptospira kirschneri]